LIERNVDGYRVEALIGVGGMGRVYRARGENGEQVALKFLHPELAGDDVLCGRFRREAQIAREIRSPHVVAVLGEGVFEGRLYLRQRFVAGGSLQQRLLSEGSLTVLETLDICTQVAEGLDALLAAGTVHRDVKPANVLLNPGGTASIADFGLAKTDGTRLTEPGQTLGSLAYIAPEQIRGEEVSAATDVYGLGCVVFHCLQGAPPFAEASGMRLLWAQLQDEPPDPCGDLTDAPDGLAPAILRALAKSPADRPQTAGEFARSLRLA
jgi:serine/threonine protein kinase